MAPNGNDNPVTICAEYISLLYLLHPVPALPSRNALETQPHREQGYILSLIEERRVTEALAFLSNDKADVNHIPALCVEQDPELSSLNVLLTVNRLGPQSGSQILQRLKLGFNEIFVLLSNVSQGGFSHTPVFSAKKSDKIIYPRF